MSMHGGQIGDKSSLYFNAFAFPENPCVRLQNFRHGKSGENAIVLRPQRLLGERKTSEHKVSRGNANVLQWNSK